MIACYLVGDELISRVGDVDHFETMRSIPEKMKSARVRQVLGKVANEVQTTEAQINACNGFRTSLHMIHQIHPAQEYSN